MWALPAWVDRHGFDRNAMLTSYAARCTAVEGNTSFYAVPALATVGEWAASTATSFRFVFKVPRVITHELRLRDAQVALDEFVAVLEPLGERAQQLTVQLPSSFGVRDLGALDAFLSLMPSHLLPSVEVRDPAFFVEGDARRRLLAILEQRKAELVTLDSRTLYADPPVTDAERVAWGKKPRLPVIATALSAHPIVRFIGRDDVDATRQGLCRWLPIVAAWLAEGRTPTMFVHTPDNVDSPAIARWFHDQLSERVDGLEPLPVPPSPSGQMGLFGN
jgi:uncharacterized protein YecE (DUF72 family)